jgi:hypothetical protein
VGTERVFAYDAGEGSCTLDMDALAARCTGDDVYQQCLGFVESGTAGLDLAAAQVPPPCPALRPLLY